MDYAEPLDMDPAEICRRQDQHKLARAIVDALWNDVDKYVMPLRMGDMYRKDVAETSILLLRDDIYDSTAIAAAQRMSNAMHGSITNPSVKWRSRKFRAPAGKLNDEPDARDWLQAADEREWDELYDSNFDPEISSGYQDLVAGGNCFMSVTAENDSPKDWQGFNFIGLPLKECFFERDHRGDVHRFYRLLNWRATECRSKWPNIKLPDPIAKALGPGGNGDDRFEIVYALYVRPGRSTSYYQVQSPSMRAVGEQYILKSTKERIGEIGGFYEMPVFHCPFERTTGSEWGHGPGMIMAPTAKYLNKWLEMEQMAVRKLVDPPNLVTERGLISDLEAWPGGITVVRDLEKSIKPYLPDARIDFSKMSVEDIRKMIREAFHNDELQLRDSPQMSATEAQIRYELMNRVLGPTMGRIQTALLSKILDRTFKTLLRNNQLGDIPQAVKDAKAQYKVVYTGALMRAQQSDQTAAIERWIGQVGAAAKVFPAVMNVVDIIQWARDLAVKLDVPAKLLRSPAEVERMVQQQQQHAAEMARQQVMAAQGTAKKAQGEGDKAVQEAAEGEPQ